MNESTNLPSDALCVKLSFILFPFPSFFLSRMQEQEQFLEAIENQCDRLSVANPPKPCAHASVEALTVASVTRRPVRLCFIMNPSDGDNPF